MNFNQYWEKSGDFGGDPQEVALLAWLAATLAERGRCTKIALEAKSCPPSGSYHCDTGERIAAKIRSAE